MTPIEFKDPSVIDSPKLSVVIQPHPLIAFWQTPGSGFKQKIMPNEHLRFIGELVEKDHIQVVIVIDEDIEDLFDRIFDAEKEMYALQKTIRFDCRVRVIPSHEKIDLMLMSYLIHYLRPEKAQ